MVHEVRIKRLAYDPEQEIVTAQLTGAMAGRNVELTLRFAFRAHGERPGTDLRNVALLEIQQILRSASNVTLPGGSTAAAADAIAAVPAKPPSGTASWENEGGSARPQQPEIIWFED